MPSNHFRNQVTLWLVAALGLLWSAIAWDAHRTEEQALDHSRRETAAWATTFASQAQATFFYVDHALMALRQTWQSHPTEIAETIKLHQDAVEGAILQVADFMRNGAEVITSGDLSCLMHLDGIIKRQKYPIRVLHMAEILNNTIER